MKILNVTKHFGQRWAQRVLEIEDEAEAKEYAAQNSEMIKEHANKTFAHSTFVWRGQLGDNITRHYYIDDDIILVTNTTDDAMITTWKVDFGFPAEANTMVRKVLVETIHNLFAQKEELEFAQLEQMEEKDNQIAIAEETISILKQQLKNAENHKKALEQDKKNLAFEVNHVDLELKKSINQLINSKEYREDIKMM